MSGTTHTTTYSYADSPSGSNPAGNSNAYLTQITNPLGHTQKFSYNYITGELASATDQNNNTTNYTYADPLTVVKQSTVLKLPCPVTLGADDRRVMLEVVKFYADMLKETPEAQRYLEKRGLKSADMVERFKLGFSDRMLGAALPDRNRNAARRCGGN